MNSFSRVVETLPGTLIDDIRSFKAAPAGENSAAQVTTVLLINGFTYGEIGTAPLTAWRGISGFSSCPFALYILALN